MIGSSAEELDIWHGDRSYDSVPSVRISVSVRILPSHSGLAPRFSQLYLSRASARYWSRVPRDLGMLTGGIYIENFSSLSFLYAVYGLVRLNLSLTLALHI